MKRMMAILIVVVFPSLLFAAGPGPGPGAGEMAEHIEQKERKAEEGVAAETILDEKDPVNQELIKNIRTSLIGEKSGGLKPRCKLIFKTETTKKMADLIVNRGANPQLLFQIRAHPGQFCLKRNMDNMMQHAIKTGNFLLLKKLVGINAQKIPCDVDEAIRDLTDFLLEVARAYQYNDHLIMDKIIDELIIGYKNKLKTLNRYSESQKYFLDNFINLGRWENKTNLDVVIIALMRHGARSAGGDAIRDPEMRTKIQQLQVEIDAENEERAKAVREEESLQLPGPLRDLILQYEGSVEPAPEQETIAEPIDASIAEAPVATAPTVVNVETMGAQLRQPGYVGQAGAGAGAGAGAAAARAAGYHGMLYGEFMPNAVEPEHREPVDGSIQAHEVSEIAEDSGYEVAE